MADTSSDDSSSFRPTYMLTTYDNPFDPFTQWDEWYAYDMNAGYHTPGLLDRIAFVSHELSDADVHMAIQDAIDEIVRENVSGIHRKVKRGDLASPAMASEITTVSTDD